MSELLPIKSLKALRAAEEMHALSALQARNRRSCPGKVPRGRAYDGWRAAGRPGGQAGAPIRRSCGRHSGARPWLMQASSARRSSSPMQ